MSTAMNLNFAKKIARKSEHARFQHGALVFKGGALKACGRNRGARHAEVDALNKMWPSERKGCVLLSIRVTKGGKLASARPCPACAQAILKSGISKVFFSTTSGDIEEMDLSSIEELAKPRFSSSQPAWHSKIRAIEI